MQGWLRYYSTVTDGKYYPIWERNLKKVPSEKQCRDKNPCFQVLSVCLLTYYSTGNNFSPEYMKANIKQY